MRCFQVVLSVVAIGAVHCNPSFVQGVTYKSPVSLSSQYHAQDILGQYSYGYSGGPSSKAETKTADGVTRGGYSYVDANGVVQSTSYVSDPVNGFRVAATNLPRDTPEVAAAKAAHAAAYVQAAVAAAEAPDTAVAVESARAVYSAAPLYRSLQAHTYTVPGIVASSDLAGGFAYSTYAPHYYSAVLPASTTAYGTHAYAAPAVVSPHGYTATYTAPGVVHATNGAGGFSYSTYSYAPHYYSAVLPTSTFPLLPSGVPADTPEVAAAKAAHYAAHFNEKLRHYYGY